MGVTSLRRIRSPSVVDVLKPHIFGNSPVPLMPRVLISRPLLSTVPQKAGGAAGFSASLQFRVQGLGVL